MTEVATLFFWKDTEGFQAFDRRFMSISLLAQGELALKTGDVRLFITAPRLLCFGMDAAPALLYYRDLKASTVSFRPQFINVHIRKEVMEREDYCRIAEKESFPLFTPFLVPCEDGYFHALPVDDWIRKAAAKAMDGCACEWDKNDDEGRTCRTRRWLLYLLTICERTYRRYYGTSKSNGIGSIPPGIRDVQAFIDLNYAEDIRLEQLCRIAKTNRNRLNALFLEYIGCTTKGYIIRCRLDAAKKLLSTTGLTIETIADACGYAYPSYFIRLFREQTGLTPSLYRQQKYFSRR